MLRGDDNRVDSCDLVIIVLNRDLALSVRTKIFQGSILANLRQLAAKLVCSGNCKRHVLRGLVAGISEHHTLVAGTDLLQLVICHLVLFDFQRLVDAHRDIRRLLINRSNDSTGVCIKSILASCIADLTNGITDKFLDIDICLGRNLTHDKDNTCRAGGLAGNTAHRILFHQCVQNRI